MREIHFVYITTYGDDWSDEERFIVHSKEEVRHYQSDEYREQQLKVSGIVAIDVEVSLDVDDTELRERLTVNEYCELFPEVKTAIDAIMKK